MKIPLIIVLFMLFSFGKPSDLIDSNGVWDKIAEFVNDAKMDFDKNFFILDLKDYSTIISDAKKRYTFTTKQKHLYETYGIKNYLFIVNDIDSKETITTLAQNLQKLISKNYGSTANSIIICMAIDIRKTRVEIGSTLNYYISDEDGLQIIDSIGDYMRSADYFNAFCKAIEKVEYYYNLGKSGGGSSSRSSSSSSSGSLPVWVVIVILLFILAACAIAICRCISRGCDIDLSSSGTYTTYSEPSYHHHHGFGGFHSHGGGYHKSGGHRSGGGGHSSGGGHRSGGGGRSGGRTGGATGGW